MFNVLNRLIDIGGETVVNGERREPQVITGKGIIDRILSLYENKGATESLSVSFQNVTERLGASV